MQKHLRCRVTINGKVKTFSTKLGKSPYRLKHTIQHFLKNSYLDSSTKLKGKIEVDYCTGFEDNVAQFTNIQEGQNLISDFLSNSLVKYIQTGESDE